jgi:hypothetical protein
MLNIIGYQKGGGLCNSSKANNKEDYDSEF